MEASQPKHGRVAVERIESDLLAANPLKDPAVRDLPVYLPPSYDHGTDRYPVIYCLPGFTGGAWNWFNFQAWVPSIDERVSRLFESGMPEVILVFPDCFTSYGGSQYLDSAAVGAYRSYLTEEIIPLVDRTFRTKPDFRGVMGKSSGGYGAITLAMERPDLFSAVACHSGDMYFEYVYMPDFPPAFRALEKAGGLTEYLSKFRESPKFGKEDHAAINTIAMSACYSPNLSASPPFIDLPFDENNGRLNTEVWARWKQKDPVEMVQPLAGHLRRLGLIYLDCGSKDEFSLNLGARIFSAELRKQNIPHEYEEFDGGHFNIQHRYDTSLRKMADFFYR